MSNAFYIADLHFGHTNIIRFDGRPFSTVEGMNDTLVANWNNRVKDSDTVYILGDFSFRLPHKQRDAHFMEASTCLDMSIGLLQKLYR